MDAAEDAIALAEPSAMGLAKPPVLAAAKERAGLHVETIANLVACTIKNWESEKSRLPISILSMNDTI